MEKRNTQQKKVIRETLQKMHCHPTASMVADRLAQEGSPASRATVFRVLSEMADQGQIRRVRLQNNDMHYDDNASPHYHFQCRKCGRIEDVSIPYMTELNLQSAEHGNLIEDHDLQFIGICAACRETGQKQPAPQVDSGE